MLRHIDRKFWPIRKYAPLFSDNLTKFLAAQSVHQNDPVLP